MLGKTAVACSPRCTQLKITMKLFQFSMAVLMLPLGPVFLQAQNAEDYRLGPGIRSMCT